MSNMVVRTNVFALNAHRNMGMVGAAQARSSARLSSGFRINSAADDAAGLAISETMRAQIRSIDQASRNAQDGISLIQTAEGALNTVNGMINRIRELTVQAANDTYTGSDRAMMWLEIEQLINEINDTAERVEFNTMTLLDGSLDSLWLQIGPNSPNGTEVVGRTVTRLGGVAGAGAANFTVAATGLFHDSTGALFAHVAGIGNTASQEAVADFINRNGRLFTGTAPITGGTPGLAALQASLSGTFDVNQLASALDGLRVSMTAPGNLTNDELVEIIGVAVGAGVTTEHVTVAQMNALREFVNSTNGRALLAAAPMATAMVPAAAHNAGSAWANAQAVANAVNASGIRQALNAALAAANPEVVGVTWDAAGDVAGAAEVTEPQSWGVFANVVPDVVDTLRAAFIEGDGPIPAFTVNGGGENIEGLLVEIDQAASFVNSARANMGAWMNRLEYTIENLDLASENLSSANSRIRDTDMAREMMAFTQANVLQQAAVAMLAQANQLPQTLLQLLR